MRVLDLSCDVAGRFATKLLGESGLEVVRCACDGAANDSLSLYLDRNKRHVAADRLPELVDYAPIESDDPVPLLAKAADWIETTAHEAGVSGLPPAALVQRETNTMPGWAGSCWYFLRFCDPQNEQRFATQGRAIKADRADGILREPA